MACDRFHRSQRSIVEVQSARAHDTVLGARGQRGAAMRYGTLSIAASFLALATARAAAPARALAHARALAPAGELELGTWRAWLESPGGELPFALSLERRDGALEAALENGSERIPVPRARLDQEELTLEIDHYDSIVKARLAADGKRLDGEWTKRTAQERWTRLEFRAERGATYRFAPLASDGAAPKARVDGRWTVRFASESDPAVGIFTTAANGTLEGTFLTTTGDYRFLAGSFEGDRLRLSCFDGAHAFLFDARLNAEGRLAGDFWSGDRWHDTWTAERDAKAVLADPFAQASWREDFGLATLVFPDTEGHERSLADPRFDGKARILQLLGTWCPNCHDETAYLAELDRKYRERGLSIVGLAFELSDEFARDVQQIERLRRRHGATYPILLAGTSDKEKAARAFPALVRILAFPTTVFLHRDGRVRAVHSGFSGPGTGAEHAALKAEFEKIVEELIAEPDADETATWSVLTADLWRDNGQGWFVEFQGESGASGRFQAIEMTRFDRPTATEPVAQGDARVRGVSVILGDRAWHFDRRTGVLLDAMDFGRRMTPAARSSLVPVVDGRGLAELDDVRAALTSPDAVWRREAIYCATAFATENGGPPVFDPTPALSDTDLFVRCTAAWAAGEAKIAGAGPRLLECLADPAAHLRREAARALGKLAYQPAAAALRERLDDYDPSVRAAAREALAALAR